MLDMCTVMHTHLSSFAACRWSAGRVALCVVITNHSRLFSVGTGASARLLLCCFTRRAIRVLRKRTRVTQRLFPRQSSAWNCLCSCRHRPRHWKTLKTATAERTRERSAGKREKRRWRRICCGEPTAQPQQRPRHLWSCCCVHRAA